MNNINNKNSKEFVELTVDDVVNKVKSVHVQHFIKNINLAGATFDIYSKYPFPGICNKHIEGNVELLYIDPKTIAMWSHFKYKTMLEPFYGGAHSTDYSKFDFRYDFRWITCNRDVLKYSDFISMPLEEINTVMRGCILAVAETLNPNETVDLDTLREAFEERGIWNLLCTILDTDFLECGIKGMERTKYVEE